MHPTKKIAALFAFMPFHSSTRNDSRPRSAPGSEMNPARAARRRRAARAVAFSSCARGNVWRRWAAARRGAVRRELHRRLRAAPGGARRGIQ
jgi:hypothetical protein